MNALLEADLYGGGLNRLGFVAEPGFVAARRYADARWYVTKSLGQVGVGNEGVANALAEALHDADKEVRGYAAESLGRLGVGNEAVVSALLAALHDGEWVGGYAAASLGRLGVGNEAVVSALLAALYNPDANLRRYAAASWERMEIKHTTQLRKVLAALNRCLHNWDWYSSGRRGALASTRQLLDGQQIPGYRWGR